MRISQNQKQFSYVCLVKNCDFTPINVGHQTKNNTKTIIAFVQHSMPTIVVVIAFRFYNTLFAYEECLCYLRI